MAFVRTKLLLTIAILIILGSGIRFYFLSVTMTHVDDIGPLTDIFIALDQRDGFLRILGSTRNWTYAPAQFLLTAFLLKFSSSVEQMIFLGRFPSWLFSVVGLIGLIFVLNEIEQDFNLQSGKSPHKYPRWMMSLIPLVFACFSWRGIIESSQSYNFATTLIAAAFGIWAFVSKNGFETCTGQKGKTKLILLSTSLGFSGWLTYQSIFLLLCGYLSTGLFLLGAKQYEKIRSLTLSGFLCFIPLFGVYRFALRAHGNRPITDWADRPLESGVIGGLRFLGEGWLQVFQNCFSISPWGAMGWITALVIIFTLAIGLWKGRSHIRRNQSALRLVFYMFMLFLVFSAGGLTKKFPLGATRHTFILQVPLLVLFAASLFWLRVRKELIFSFALLSTLVFAIHISNLYRAIGNQIDYPLLRSLISQYQNAHIVDFPLSFTRDQLLLGREYGPQIALDRFKSSERGGWEQVLGDPNIQTLIILGHRRPLNLEQKTALALAGYVKIEAVREIHPVGSTELIGNINGGNGFFVYLARR